MSIIIRLLIIFCCSALPITSSIAGDGREAAIAIERAVASCLGNQQCEAAVRKREILAAEKRQKREAADIALKESNPGSYYLTLLARFLTAVAIIVGVAGIYVLVMHLLFGKRRRRR
jgi:hypothetical protein